MMMDANIELWERTLDRVAEPPQERRSFASSEKASLCIVMVEFRRHPWLEKVLWNAAHVYGGKYGVTLSVVCGTGNEAFVKRIVGSWPGASVHVLPHDNLDIQGYNRLLKSVAFYELFSPCQSILVIQSDTLTRKAVPEKFIELYSYVGAPWAVPQLNGPADGVVGNGGYSLREVDAMKRACLLHSSDAGEDGVNEDLFFAKHGNGTRRCIAPAADASAFSVEHVAHPDPCGMHQAYRFHPRELLEHWLKDLPGTT